VNMDAVDLERMRRVLQHRLLNIVSGVKSASSYLSGLLDDRLKPREREYFPLIINECDQVCLIVDRLDQLFGVIPAVSPVSLREGLSTVLELVQADNPMAHLLKDIEVADEDQCVCRGALRAILVETVRNASQSSREPVQIVVRDQGAGCAVRVIDQGAGFSAEAETMAMKPFFTTKAKSLGLGLSIALRLVEARGGRADLGSEARGTYVEFYLPYLTV
jgi:signal transduction histidine kinase